MVALAGSTGSGKSSLFNVLVRRRPARRSASGARRRRRRTPASGDPTARRRWCSGWACRAGRRTGGTVRVCARRSSASWPAWSCSTCPTTTPPSSSTGTRSTDWSSSSTCWSGWSTRRSTPTEVLHESYLRRLAGHEAVTVVVLNQVDTVNPFAAAECAEDLRRLLDADGLPSVAGAHLLGAHRRRASTGCGRCWRTRSPSARPATTGWSPTSRTSSSSCCTTVSADEPTGVAGAERAQLVEALAVVGRGPRGRRGGRGVVAAAAPAGCWAGRRPGGSAGCAPTRCAGCTCPATTASRSARSWSARRCPSRPRCSAPRSTPRCGGPATPSRDDLPRRGSAAVRTAAAGSRSADVRDALDQAVVGTDLGVDRVTASGGGLGAALQWLLTLAARGRRPAGCCCSASARTCGCRTRRLPSWPGSPCRPCCWSAGCCSGCCSRSWAGCWCAAGAARRRRAESRLRSAIEQVADELMLGPVEAELARHGRARAGPGPGAHRLTSLHRSVVRRRCPQIRRRTPAGTGVRRIVVLGGCRGGAARGRRR